MSEQPKFDVATTTVDGRAIKREIIIDGMVVGEIGDHDAVEFAMKLVSSFRFSFPTTKMR